MGVSKAQKAGVLVTCKCGCGTGFLAFPTYRPKAQGGGLRVPEYRRGHHPQGQKALRREPWNKGLTKDQHPSIERMGFQVGHAAFNDWSAVNARIAHDSEFNARWREAKKGQKAWNAGITKAEYPNGIASGEDHGNWKGGRSGETGTAKYAEFRMTILKRDDYTCRACGDKNRTGRGSRIRLEVHHILSVAAFPEFTYDESNVITLCRNCHYKTHNYGAKNIGKKSCGK